MMLEFPHPFEVIIFTQNTEITMSKNNIATENDNNQRPEGNEIFLLLCFDPTLAGIESEKKMKKCGLLPLVAPQRINHDRTTKLKSIGQALIFCQKA